MPTSCRPHKRSQASARVSPKVGGERIGHANVGIFLRPTPRCSRTTTARQPSQAASFRLGKAGDPVAEADSQDDDKG